MKSGCLTWLSSTDSTLWISAPAGSDLETGSFAAEVDAGADAAADDLSSVPVANARRQAGRSVVPERRSSVRRAMRRKKGSVSSVSGSFC